MEENKTLNNQNKEEKKKNKFIAWWLGLGKWTKVVICAGTVAVLVTAITLPIVLIKTPFNGRVSEKEWKNAIDTITKIEGRNFVCDITGNKMKNSVKTYQYNNYEKTVEKSDETFIYFNSNDNKYYEYEDTSWSLVTPQMYNLDYLLNYTDIEDLGLKKLKDKFSEFTFVNKKYELVTTPQEGLTVTYTLEFNSDKTLSSYKVNGQTDDIPEHYNLFTFSNYGNAKFDHPEYK